MILLTLYVAATARPPVAEAMVRAVAPSQLDILVIVTLVGGTVGGYITFAGGHRLIDAGMTGVNALGAVSRSAVTGIVVTGIMRVLLFLAALGVVARGLALDAANPPASVFRHAAGEIGYRFFGAVMWSAAITSVVGASYTSVSFLRTLHPRLDAAQRPLILAFIITAATWFVLVGRPVKTLIFVGALNGMILPIALSSILLAAYNKAIVGDYRHPRWLVWFGAGVVIVMTLLSAYTIVSALRSL
jgi:Mn2+/Fe2+ NRAMP family transporter